MGRQFGGRGLPWLLPIGIAAWLLAPSFRNDDPISDNQDDPVEPAKEILPDLQKFGSPDRDPDPALVDLTDPQDSLGVNSSGRARWGWLRIEDPSRISLGVLASAVSAEGWTALPRKALLGASSVVFRKGRPEEGQILGGTYRIGDPIGLWKLETEVNESTLPLRPYDPERIVQRRQPGGVARDWIPTSGLQSVGSFLFVQESVLSPEILIQDGALVGWLIPEGQDDSGKNFSQSSGAWLWNGPPGLDLAIQATLNEFQQSEFMGGVVEGYRQIFADDLDDLSALALLDSARRRIQRLAPEDIPEPYRREALLLSVRERLSNGLGNDPLDYFWGISAASVLWLEDPLTARIWMALALESEDPDCLSTAINTLTGLPFSTASPQVLKEIEELLAELWVTGVESYRGLGNLDLARSWIEQGRISHPQHDTLRMLDAERLLDIGLLDAAEASLLPPVRRADLVPFREGLLERLRLARTIEGRILVRFTPGSPVIEAIARVGNVPVRFLVDTGASATSIPVSVVDQLGITLSDRTLQRRIRTASDEFMAPVVNLPAVNLEGALVEGIQATVLDLPGQPGVGLLGLDFLSKFRLDIDVEKGWLLLEPR